MRLRFKPLLLKASVFFVTSSHSRLPLFLVALLYADSGKSSKNCQFSRSIVGARLVSIHLLVVAILCDSISH
jgi:hypothetical protein